MRDKIYKKLLPFIILVQPFFDMLTSVMTRSGYKFTIGMVLKVILIALFSIYLIFFDKKNLKKNLIFLTTIFIFLITNLFINYNVLLITKTVYLGYLIKYAYAVITIYFFYRWFKNGNSIKLYELRLPLAIITIIFFLALITNTSFYSYDELRGGVSGWFNSANELGALLCLFFPISIHNAFHNPERKILDFFLFIASGLMLILVGTKTGLLGFGLTILCYLIYRIVSIKTSKIDYRFIIVLVYLILPLFIWNNLPAVYNLKYKVITNDMTEMNKENINNIVFSGREEFLKIIKNDRKNINTWQILFGKPCLVSDTILIVERDFIDIYYMFGIVGLAIFSSAFFILIMKILLLFIKHFNVILINRKAVFCITSMILSLAIAYISGHVLLSPSVSTYFCLIIIVLYDKCNKIIEGEPEKEKRVMFISSVGGHLTQILQLKSLFNNYNYVLVTEKNDVTKSMKEKYNVSFLPYASRNQKLSYPFKLLYNCIKSAFYFDKYCPDIIVTTGANTAAAMCCIGKIFGKKVIYIESYAKNTSPTITGKLIYKLHAYTTFVVQWESMLKFYPDAEYWGGIY